MGTPQFEVLESVNQPGEGAFWAGVGSGVAVGLILLACSS
jgi:hypothetical protein